MANLSNTLERLRGLRLEMGLSPEDMGKAAGISAAEYSAVEDGAKDVSFTFLQKCAARLGVDLSSLVSGEEPRLSGYVLNHQGEGMDIRRRDGLEYLHLAYMFKNRLAEPFVVTAKYAKTLENSPLTLSRHGGQEFNYILRGKLKVQIEDHVEILSAGDSLFYDGQKRHGMVAAGGEDCVFLSLVMKGMDEDSALQPVEEPGAGTRAPAAEDDRIYRKFVRETLDADGYLQDIQFNIPDNFNFGYDVVDELARKAPDKLAMQWVNPANGEERRFTFGDISRLSNQAANHLRALGIGKGDKVMLVLRRHYQFWYVLTALHKIGAVAIPATDQLVTKDFVYRFDKAGVKAVLCSAYGQTAAMVDAAMEKCQQVKIRCLVNAGLYGARAGWDDFDAGVAAASPEFARVATGKDDVQLMFFSSGTTGYPKIVQHRASYALGHIITAKWWHNVQPDGLHFAVSDTGWGKALWGKFYGQWLCEAAVFTCDFERFNPVDILPMFAKYHITTFCAPPTVFRFFIKEDLAKYDLSSLRYACIAGEALNPEVYNRFRAATGIKLMEGFGQTETTLTVFNRIGMTPKPGSMGKPSPAYDVRLLDAAGREVKCGDVGEVCIGTGKGVPPGMFAGYYDDPEKTEEAWHDGVYHTGDTAWRDEDGYFWYVGRTDDLIKSSGYRIGPFEIESVLMEMPCVTECAVTGVPDTTGQRGQLVKATIVLSKGFAPSDELKKEIQNYVKKNTAPYKYPRVVEFVDALPKTISGKIRRVELRGREK